MEELFLVFIMDFSITIIQVREFFCTEGHVHRNEFMEVIWCQGAVMDVRGLVSMRYI